MGGHGSGRYGKKENQAKGRAITASCISLTTECLKKYIKSPEDLIQLKGTALIFTIENKGTFRVTVYDEGIYLSYSLKNKETGEKEIYTYPVRLDFTPCNYGNYRIWFICPDCCKRVAILYLKQSMFLCRHCQRLSYASSQISGNKFYEITRYMKRLQSLLQTEQNVWNLYPKRPKFMQYKTYFRLMERLHATYELRVLILEDWHSGANKYKECNIERLISLYQDKM